MKKPFLQNQITANSNLLLTLDIDLHRINLVVIFVLSCTVVALFVTGHIHGTVAAWILWGLACLGSGSVVGFLFGIPRAAPQDKTRFTSSSTGATDNIYPEEHSPYRMRPNTNLEEVSDWLTKIIVGLGLVHLQDFENMLYRTAKNAASAMSSNTDPPVTSLATAMIVSLVIEGFFIGYLYTRLFLQGAFARSDFRMNETVRRIEKVIATVPSGVPVEPATESLPSQAQMQAAAEIERISADEPGVAIEKMRALAAEYEQIRATMPSGRDRTYRMSRVVADMTLFTKAARSQLNAFMESTRPGERLAAVVMIKTQPEMAYSRWLAQRLVEDPPFVGYQAANALLAIARLHGGSQLEELRHQVREADMSLEARNLKTDPPRDKLVQMILNDKYAPEDHGRT